MGFVFVVNIYTYFRDGFIDFPADFSNFTGDFWFKRNNKTVAFSTKKLTKITFSKNYSEQNIDFVKNYNTTKCSLQVIIDFWWKFCEYVDENVDHNFDFWRKFFGEKCNFGNNFNFLLKYVYQKFPKLVRIKHLDFVH